MTSEERTKRLKELGQIEEELKTNRNFEGLIKIHDESMKLFDHIGNHTERMTQKAYCLARLGRKMEAEQTLKELSKVSFFVDQDELFRAITLVSFFLTTPASELNLMQINTIKNWLKDPQASKQVLQVVFDYSDFVGNITPFDNSRLQIKQTYFSSELLEWVYFAMERNDTTKIYYNRETNDVQQEVSGYLSSNMTSDQSAENRRLENRIMNSDSKDPIIDGIHFLIPRLTLSSFLQKFAEYAEGNDALIAFIKEFESSIMEDYSYVASIQDLFFNAGVSNNFFTKLDSWYRNNDFNINELNGIINKTINSIATEFLIKVNK